MGIDGGRQGFPWRESEIGSAGSRGGVGVSCRCRHRGRSPRKNFGGERSGGSLFRQLNEAILKNSATDAAPALLRKIRALTMGRWTHGG